MMLRILLASIATLTICLFGCSSPEFSVDTVKEILEGAPLNLTDEQARLTEGQVDCGARNELWDPPNGNVARLSQKGRDLKFTDDVRLNDPEIPGPYIQVSGAFPVTVTKVSKLRKDGKGNLVDVRLGIIIKHECFTSPLPLMGIRKGKFTPDAAVVFRFLGSGQDWTLDKLMH
jgi:hypothetical protein